MEITGSLVGKGVAIVGGGSVSGYGVYALTSGGESMEFEEAQTDTPSESLIGSWPDFLFQVKDFGTESSEYGPNTFGYAFGRFMLNPNGDSELWPKREFRAEESSKDDSDLSSEFKVLDTVTGDENKDLQQVCKEIYKKSKNDVLNNSLLWRDVWLFCAVDIYPPYTVNKVQTSKEKYKTKWAGLANNGDALFDIEGVSNEQGLWDHVYTNILKVAPENSKSSQFLSIGSGNELSVVCGKAYESNSTPNQSTYGDNVREYCILDASVSLSQYPTTPVT